MVRNNNSTSPQSTTTTNNNNNNIITPRVSRAYLARISRVSRRLLSIVMEYADGGTLADAIDAQRSLGDVPFKSAMVRKWVLEVASALAHVHDHHILHRDLKTANVFLTSAGASKLGDFGISRALSTQADLGELPRRITSANNLGE